jgi:hypothetical protein
VGVGSGKTLNSVGAANLDGQTMTVRKTKPTVTLAAGSPSGAGIPGLNEVLRFTVAADANSDVVLQAVTIKVTSTDNAGHSWNVGGDADGVIDLVASWKLYDSSDLNTAVGTVALYDTDGAALADTKTVGFARVSALAKTIAAGTSKTYVLKVDTTGASSSQDDSVRFDVSQEGGAGGALGALKEFNWDETSSGSVTDIDGTLIKNLPVNGGTIIY